MIAFLADELLAAAAQRSTFHIQASIVSISRISSVDDGDLPRARPFWDVAVVLEDGTASAVVELHPDLAEKMMGMSTGMHSQLGEGSVTSRRESRSHDQRA